MIHVFDVTSAREFNPITRTIAIRCMSSTIARTWEREEYGELDPKKYVGILPLIIDDIVPAMIGRDGEAYKGYSMFNEEHAKDIGDFLEKHWGNFEDIMIHCYAGASRSTAVGRAIGDHFQIPYNPEILERQEMGPNGHIHVTLLGYLRKRFPEGKITRIH
jgi:predicted protein tyrosine phosphatase